MTALRRVSRIILTLLITTGCAESQSRKGRESSQRFVKENGFSADPLTYTAVSRTLLTEQNYFVSYSQTSGRLGIIDADQYQEIWGTYIDKSIPYVFNLPGYEGAGFVDVGSFTVVVREGMRRFEVPELSEAAWNRARSVIAVAGYDPVGRKLHVIRFRGTNQWEQAAIEVFSADDGIGSGRVVVSDQGKLILLIDAATGSHAVLADENGAYTLRHKCVFTDSSSFSGAVIDETLERAYVVADKQVLEVDLRAGAGCVKPADWHEVLIGSGAMSDIGLLDSERIYVTESGTSPGIHILTRTQDDLVPSPSFPTCSEPKGINTFGDNGVVATCVNRTTATDEFMLEGRIAGITLEFYSGDGAKISSSDIGFDRKAGVVFYPQKSQFFQIFDSAAGEVVITDVNAGSSRKVGGIYFEGVLNKL
jgi:hypothetical protein